MTIIVILSFGKWLNRIKRLIEGKMGTKKIILVNRVSKCFQREKEQKVKSRPDLSTTR